MFYFQFVELYDGWLKCVRSSINEWKVRLPLHVLNFRTFCFCLACSQVLDKHMFSARSFSPHPQITHCCSFSLQDQFPYQRNVKNHRKIPKVCVHMDWKHTYKCFFSSLGKICVHLMPEITECIFKLSRGCLHIKPHTSQHTRSDLCYHFLYIINSTSIQLQLYESKKK